MKAMYKNTDIKEMRIEVITPEKAQQYLNCNYGNRRLKIATVKRYAQTMIAGEWKTTHQGIALSSDGNIIDGQHRLQAVVNSGISIKIPVIIYENKGGALSIPIDNMSKRGFSDRTGIDRSSASLCKFMASIINKKADIYAYTIYTKAPEIKEFVEKIGYEQKKYISAVKNILPFFLIYYAGDKQVVEQYKKIKSRKMSSYNKIDEKLDKLIYDDSLRNGMSDRIEHLTKVYTVLKYNITLLHRKTVEANKREILYIIQGILQ